MAGQEVTVRRVSFLIACVLVGSSSAFSQTSTEHSNGSTDARAELKDAAGRAVGDVRFTDTPNGLLVHATLSDVAAGTHALHIHTTGRCDAPSFESAGGHFNPTNRQHGFLDAKGPHAGDLPNVHVAGSPLRVDLFVPDVRLRTGPAMLLDADGAAVVIHAGADDYRSEPAGDAGRRVACGVVSVP
jgi:Cu-Zn family superoxide dismutase